MKVMMATDVCCYVYNGDCYIVQRAYDIFSRYGNNFGKVILCSRIKHVNEVPFDCVKADFISDVVECNDLLYALIGKYEEAIVKLMRDCDLIIGRFPSIIAFRVFDYAKKINKPFLAELMCDGWDPYWYHGLKGKMIAPYMNSKMKRCTRDAEFAIYVTQSYLQNKYPCRNYHIGVSNVIINECDKNILYKRLNNIRKCDYSSIKMMTSATVDLRSKGQEYVVRAMGILKKRGISIKYYLAGDGDSKYLKKIARICGVEDDLIFLGRLKRVDVLKKLDEVDIYIQPSLQEGLPRAVIEAMSRGCPVLGARTAGIPELIDDECVFERASAKSIVNKIEYIIKKGMDRYARANYQKSCEFNENILNERRDRYFKYISDKLSNDNN